MPYSAMESPLSTLFPKFLWFLSYVRSLEVVYHAGLPCFSILQATKSWVGRGLGASLPGEARAYLNQVLQSLHHNCTLGRFFCHTILAPWNPWFLWALPKGTDEGLLVKGFHGMSSTNPLHNYTYQSPQKWIFFSCSMFCMPDLILCATSNAHMKHKWDASMYNFCFWLVHLLHDYLTLQCNNSRYTRL